DHLVPSRSLSPDTVVAEFNYVEPLRRRFDHGVAGILLPGEQSVDVVARGDARQLLRASAAAVDDGGHAVVVDRTARPAAVFVGRVGRGSEGNWQVRPVHKVGARRVAPVYLVVESALRVVLVEDVVDALPLYQPVRVIHPVGRR